MSTLTEPKSLATENSPYIDPLINFRRIGMCRESPVVTPLALSLLRDVGMKPEILSNFMDIKRVSSCDLPPPSLSVMASGKRDRKLFSNGFMDSMGGGSCSKSARRDDGESEEIRDNSTSGYASGMDIDDEEMSTNDDQ